jgi:hypothetical protein
MRKTLQVLSIAAVAAALATPALAQEDDRYPVQTYAAAPVVTSAAVGTTAGVGLFNGWWGSSAAVGVVPATVGTSIALGGVAGIGTIAAIDAVTQPCRGWQALLGVNHGKCADGQWVGDAPIPRVIRR